MDARILREEVNKSMNNDLVMEDIWKGIEKFKLRGYYCFNSLRDIQISILKEKHFKVKQIKDSIDGSPIHKVSW